jgi:ribonuclease P protein component
LYIFRQENISPLQAGFTVSAKYFKKAVDRNRIKRMMREGYRLQKDSLTETLKNHKRCMAVFFIYTGNAIPEYKDVAEKMLSALKRLNKIAGEITAPNT